MRSDAPSRVLGTVRAYWNGWAGEVACLCSGAGLSGVGAATGADMRALVGGRARPRGNQTDGRQSERLIGELVNES